MKILSKSHKRINARELQYGDIIRQIGYDNVINQNLYFTSGAFQDLTVVKIDGREITLARPHVVLNEYESGFTIGTEIIIINNDSPHEYFLIDNHFHPNVAAKMCDEIRELINSARLFQQKRIDNLEIKNPELREIWSKESKEMITKIENIMNFGPTKK